MDDNEKKKQNYFINVNKSKKLQDTTIVMIKKNKSITMLTGLYMVRSTKNNEQKAGIHKTYQTMFYKYS